LIYFPSGCFKGRWGGGGGGKGWGWGFLEKILFCLRWGGWKEKIVKRFFFFLFFFSVGFFKGGGGGGGEERKVDGQGFQYKMLVVKKDMMDPKRATIQEQILWKLVLSRGAKEIALLWTPGKSINWNVRCFFSLCLGTDLAANMLPNNCILGFISLQCPYLSEFYLTLNIKLLFIIIQFS